MRNINSKIGEVIQGSLKLGKKGVDALQSNRNRTALAFAGALELMACNNDTTNASFTDTVPAPMTGANSSTEADPVPTTTAQSHTEGKGGSSSDDSFTSTFLTESSGSNETGGKDTDFTTGDLRSKCGNGITEIDGAEECDDGNEENDLDPCSNDCKVNLCVHGVKLMASNYDGPFENNDGNFAQDIEFADGDLAISATHQEKVNELGGAIYFFRQNFGQWLAFQKLYPYNGDGWTNIGWAMDSHENFMAVSNTGPYILQKQGMSWQSKGKIVPNGLKQVGDVQMAKDFIVTRDLSGDNGSVFEKDENESWKETGNVVSNEDMGGEIATNGVTIVFSKEDYNENKGGAFVFEQVNGKWVQKQILTIPEGILFGRSIAMNEDSIFIGSKYDGVRIYQKENDEWIENQNIPGENNGTDLFGNAIAVYGKNLIIGAQLKDSDQPGIIGQGKVHLFKEQGNIWQEKGHFLGADNPNHEHEGFGQKLAINEKNIAIKANEKDYMNSVYVFCYDSEDPIPK